MPQKLKFIEAFAGPFGDCTEGIFSYMDRQTCFLTQKLVKPTQQRPSACEYQSSIDKVRRKLVRTALQRNAYRIDYRRDRLKQCFAHFLRRTSERSGQTSDQVASLNFYARFLFTRICRADLDFDFFGRAFANHQVVSAFHILHDRLVQLVPSDTDTSAKYNFGRRNKGGLSRPSANIDE